MKNRYNKAVMLFVALAVLTTAPAFAEQANSPIPFGGYRKGGKCGYYGARVAIKTADEARKVIGEFLVGHDLRIGAMDERPRFFRAEIVDGNGTVRDVVIVNKVNGRVRSAY